MGPDNLTNVFAVLKQVMKRRGLTYRDLAESVGTSEGAVKNMFLRSTCALERLVEVCGALGLSVSEVFKTAEAHSSEILVLSEEQEQHFADHPDVFRFFRLCFYEELSPRAVKRKWKLDDRALERYLKTLEELGLAERHPGQRLVFLVRGKLRWRPRGPWMKRHLAAINELAAERVLAEAQSYYSLGFSTLTLDQRHGFATEVEGVVRKYQDIAARDYLVRDSLDQHPFSWTFALVSGDICVEAAR